MHSENHGALTFYDKLWQRHLVDETPSGEVLLYVDRQLVYEVTSPHAWTKKQDSQSQAVLHL
jgi:homoaconitase/3-isopropylmalate dehydratase large subunit